MGKITPFNKQDPQLWKQQNKEAIKKIHDNALKAIIDGVLNLHELEHTGEWKHLGRRLDYANQHSKHIFSITRPGPLLILDCLKRLSSSTLMS